MTPVKVQMPMGKEMQMGTTPREMGLVGMGLMGLLPTPLETGREMMMGTEIKLGRKKQMGVLMGMGRGLGMATEAMMRMEMQMGRAMAHRCTLAAHG